MVKIINVNGSNKVAQVDICKFACFSLSLEAVFDSYYWCCLLLSKQPVAYYSSSNEVRVDLKHQQESSDALVVTWQNVNVHTPNPDQGILSKVFNRNKPENERNHIIQNGRLNTSVKENI